jgi:hypothetical protein
MVVGSTLETDASSYFAMTLNAVVVWFKFTLPPVSRHISTIKVAVHLSDHSFDGSNFAIISVLT